MKKVAELVDDLFRTHRRPDGQEYTYKEISEFLGGKIESSHLSKLRTGKITNPSRETILALCRFFQVPASYFFPELDPVPQPGNAESREADLTLVQIALRTTGLRPDIQMKIEELITALQHMPRLQVNNSQKQ